jgi:hypothetical protein
MYNICTIANYTEEWNRMDLSFKDVGKFFLWPLVIDRAPDLVPLKIEVVRMSRPGEQLVASRVGQGRSHGQGCGEIMLHSIHAAKYG